MGGVSAARSGQVSFLLTLGGAGLAIAMLNRAFLSLNPLPADSQVTTFVACEAGLGMFFLGLYMLLGDWLRKPASGPAWWTHPAALGIVAGNAIPLLGVVFWGWPIFPLVVLFWLEAAVAMAYVALDMALDAKIGIAGAAIFAAFFLVFWTLYGTAVYEFFGREIFHDLGLRLGPSGLLAVIGHFHLGWPLLAIIACHGMQFLSYLSRDRPPKKSVVPGDIPDTAEAALVAQPLLRMGTLHLVLIFGGYLIDEIGSPGGAILLLVLLKAGIELLVHTAMQPRADKLEPAKADVATGFVAPQVSHARVDPNDKPLAHYLGRWLLAAGENAPPGLFEGVEFLLVGGAVKVRLAGVSGDESEVEIRGGAQRIEFIEARLRGAGVERVLRFTASADPGRIDLNEIQERAGDARTAQARSFSLRRA